MSKLGRLCAVAFLSAVLSVSAFAGTIDSPGVATPPPPSGTTTSTSITTTVVLTILSLIR